jgi:hypothetical protein
MVRCTNITCRREWNAAGVPPGDMTDPSGRGRCWYCARGISVGKAKIVPPFGPAKRGKAKA